MPALAAWSTSFPQAEAALIGLAFAWGAALGSFLNVVVHRVPQGKSVVVGGSRCPRCGAGIRPRDNLPILGWLALRGRCRDCGLPISARYPIVEAACGCLAAAVAAAELAGGGRWLPQFSVGPAGVDRLLLHGEWRLLVSWGLHTVMLLAVLAWTLLAADQARSPCHGAFAVLVATAAVVTAIPDVGPVGLLPAGDRWPAEPPWAAAFAAVVAGGLAGRLCGHIVGQPADACSLSLVGATLGWQAAVVVAVVTVVCRRVVRFATAASPDPSPADAATLVLAALGYVACWQPLTTAWAAAWQFVAGS